MLIQPVGLSRGLHAADRPVEQVLQRSGQRPGVFRDAEEQRIGSCDLAAQIGDGRRQRVMVVVGIEVGECAQPLEERGRHPGRSDCCRGVEHRLIARAGADAAADQQDAQAFEALPADQAARLLGGQDPQTRDWLTLARKAGFTFAYASTRVIHRRNDGGIDGQHHVAAGGDEEHGPLGRGPGRDLAGAPRSSLTTTPWKCRSPRRTWLMIAGENAAGLCGSILRVVGGRHHDERRAGLDRSTERGDVRIAPRRDVIGDPAAGIGVGVHPARARESA